MTNTNQEREMEEREGRSSSTPKLSLYALPNKPQEPPGLLTPPLHTLASVPFKWEEAPGKPRPSTAPSAAASPPSKSKAARCLDLPPRLLVTESAKVTSMPSPTTVLDGPYVGRTFSFSWSFRSPEERKVGGGVKYGKRESKERIPFSSWRWGSSKDYGGPIGGSFDISYPACGGSMDDTTKVKITRASIYGSFKQAVPWRRGQDKTRKMGS
ncbi:hypothetical protein RJ639_032665 [Escallonia herrerae]|uniref:Uncharacterized protein n=1 Tax=Escallonia herrerae TaxID=1293975 RepID=A0AA89BFK6_9ASTE|nr:hypothetical protein RJ639_032665 [Escallonia herrerae]